jgi:hypothetical protein
MDCGLVLDQLLGLATEDHNVHNTFRVSEAREKELDQRRRHLSFYTDQLHLTNQYMIERMLTVYNSMYGDRTDVKKSKAKLDVALAYSIYKVMCDENIPRPPQYITNLFDENNVKKTASMSGKKLLNASEYIIVGSGGSGSAQKKECKAKKIEERLIKRKHSRLPFITTLTYVQTLCDNLQVSYQSAQTIKQRVKLLMWKKTLVEIRPEVLIGGVLLIVLVESQELGESITTRDVLWQVSSTKKYLKKAVMKILAFKKLWCVESNNSVKSLEKIR